MVNSELELAAVEILNTKVYDCGVELFLEKSDTSFYSVNILSSTNIFRDSVYLTATGNDHSYIDRTAEANIEYTYTARPTHPYGK